MAINDKNEFPKIPTSYSPTVALIEWKHLTNSYIEKNDRLSLWEKISGFF